MAAYYNEFDPHAAAWLRELIKRGLITDGEVDERSILDVSADELRGFTQCHFFAGIGGWSYALRLAGWPDDRPVWTGSPPCQPFSAAGKNLGRDDARHLAPHFIGLVGAARPPVLFGEQVASSAVFGSAAKPNKRGDKSAPEWAWLDDLSDRLEAAQYAVGAADIPAAFVGAPHIRQRTFFGAVRLADASSEGSHASSLGGLRGSEGGAGAWNGEPERQGAVVRLADASGEPSQWNARGVFGTQATEYLAREFDGRGTYGYQHGGATERLADADRRKRLGIADGEGCQHYGEKAGRQQGDCEPERDSAGGGMADATGRRWRKERKDCRRVDVGDRKKGRSTGCITGRGDHGMADAPSGGCGHERQQCGGEYGFQPQDRGDVREGHQGPQLRTGSELDGTNPHDGFWRGADWLFCRDGKWRPAQPGLKPLVDGLPRGMGRGGNDGSPFHPSEARVMRLRGYGNAIVPDAAAQFITMFSEASEI